MSIPVFLRPSVLYTEIDLTQRIDVIISTTAAVVGEFDRGPLEPTYNTGTSEDFGLLYGKTANPSLSFAHDTVTSFKTQSANVLVTRTVKDALYSGGTVFLDRVRNRVRFVPFATGTTGNYLQEGLTDLFVVSFTGTFATGSTFETIVTNGNTVQSVSVDFDTNHDTTMRAIAAAIQSAVQVYGFATAAVVPELQGDTNTITVRMPKNALVQLIDPETTGTNAPTVTASDESRWFDVFAENPGKWSDGNYGIQLASFDSGTRERYSLTLSKAIATGQSFSTKINGEVIGPVAFRTDSDTTLQDIAAAIAAHRDVATATVTGISGAANNDREIIVVAQRPAAGAVVWADTAFAGASPPFVAVSTTLTGVASDETFNFNVYSTENINRPVDQFVVSLRDQLNTLGNQTNIEYTANKSSRRSIHIRVAQEQYTRDAGFTILSDTGEAPTSDEYIHWLRGGTDGFKCTSAEIRQGWDKIRDRRYYPVALLLNGGYTAKAVQKHIDALAQARGDCLAILDAPSEYQGAQALRRYRIDELDIDSNYSAMYTPDVEIEDYYTGQRRYIPPSGPVGATYCYSDRLTNGLGAPAGLNRGKVTIATGLRYNYTEEDEKLLYPIGINCIIDKKLTGPTVMGEETLQVKKTVLSSVHARRILNIIKVGLTDGLEYTLFDPSTEHTRWTATQLGYTIINPLIPDGLYRGTIQCDEKNNPPSVIDADVLNYFVSLQIVRVVKGINLKAYLTRTGENRFEESVAE